MMMFKDHYKIMKTFSKSAESALPSHTLGIFPTKFKPPLNMNKSFTKKSYVVLIHEEYFSNNEDEEGEEVGVAFIVVHTITSYSLRLEEIVVDLVD